ncbi:MAG: AAA family ATPase [Vibrio sp.]|uniref:AAA family ATPase n=1 Tax=Vibrio sp. TaxID=678 RepID=UPI003A8B4EC7
MSNESSEKGLCNVFFSGAKYFINDRHVDLDFLCHRKSVLPIVLAAIELVIDDPIMMNTMLRYKLKYDHHALCLVSASDVEIVDKNRLFSTIQKFGGFDCLKNWVSIRDAEDSVPHYELMSLCETVQNALKGAATSDELTARKHFSFLKSKLLFNKEVAPEFTIESFYQSLDSMGKSFIEEIAVVACANYFSSHRNQSLENILARTTFSVDENCLLAASLSDPQLLNVLAKHFGCKAYQLVFSKEVYDLRDNMFRFSEPRNFGSPSTTWFLEAKKQYSKLTFSKDCLDILSNAREAGGLSLDALVKHITQSSSDVMQKFISLNPIRNDLVYRTQISQKIRTSLNDKVIGQEAAVDGICRGYLSSSIEYQQGPRSIYTFVGPSGVGKTFLAKQLLEQIEQFELTGNEFNIFNMENYADYRDGSRLFGSGSQYTDSSLGVLTRLVTAKPRQILLFDEIEKAHSSVIQSLLSVLDSALAKDQTSQEEVDFSQCIIIFTTNLGHEIINSNTQNKTLSVIDILKNRSNPSNNVSLSPEFINRLAKGYPIIFKQLKVNHLVKLAEIELRDNALSEGAISFKWKPQFAPFLLKTLSPEINVRALKSQTAKLQADILTRSASYFDAITNQDVQFLVEADLGHNDRSFKLLLLDDDKRVFDKLESASDDLVCLCQNVDRLEDMLEKELPDALLIDITVIESTGLRFSDFVSQYIKSKQMPLFTYRLVDSKTSAVVSYISHDVREHFDIELNVENQIKGSASKEIRFSEMLQRIQHYLSIEHTLTKMINRKEAIEYSFSVHPDTSGLRVKFSQNSIQQVIDGEDLTDSHFFKMTLPTVVLNDVIGLDRAKKRLVDVLGWLNTPEKLGHLGVPVPSGFLFSGPSGTGKTLLAKAVAGESGLPFFAVSASQLSSSYEGGTVENIKTLFPTARKYAPAIVFIDEIDAVAAKRSSRNGLSERNAVVNALLTEMDGFATTNDGVFVMAATNHPDLLDEAIVRPGRFDETIQCDLPNSVARKLFFERFINRHRLSSSDFDLLHLVAASRGMSSAEIDQVLREVIYESVSKKLVINDALIRETIIRVNYGTPSEHIVLSETEKLRIAYHEAGHLLTSVLLFPDQDIDFVTIEPRNYALGFVATRPLAQYEGYSKTLIFKRLEVLLAGRVAEQVFFGSENEVSTGASNDISKATQLVMHAIYEAGLEPTVGPIDVGMVTKFEESDLLLKAQSAVQAWLSKAEQAVFQRLTSQRCALDQIAQQLHEKESLMNNEIKNLIRDLKL